MMPGGGTKHKSKPRQIRLGFSLGLAGKVGCILLLGLLIHVSLFWLVSLYLSGAEYGETIRSLDLLQLMLFSFTLGSCLVQMALACLLVCAVGVLASHKIAGPLVRYRRAVYALGEGDLRQSISFRAGDEDQRLPEALRAAKDRVIRHLEGAHAAQRRLEEVRDDLGSRPPDEAIGAEDARGLVDRLAQVSLLLGGEESSGSVPGE